MLICRIGVISVMLAEGVSSLVLLIPQFSEGPRQLNLFQDPLAPRFLSIFCRPFPYQHTGQASRPCLPFFIKVRVSTRHDSAGVYIQHRLPGVGRGPSLLTPPASASRAGPRPSPGMRYMVKKMSAQKPCGRAATLTPSASLRSAPPP